MFTYIFICKLYKSLSAFALNQNSIVSLLLLLFHGASPRSFVLTVENTPIGTRFKCVGTRVLTTIDTLDEAAASPTVSAQALRELFTTIVCNNVINETASKNAIEVYSAKNAI